MSNNKLSDNNLASELVENRIFFKPITIEENVIFMISSNKSRTIGGSTPRGQNRDFSESDLNLSPKFRRSEETPPFCKRPLHDPAIIAEVHGSSVIQMTAYTLTAFG